VPKKVSDAQKEEMKNSFLKGYSIEDISKTMNFSIQTITRQLKILIGEVKFKKIKKNKVLEKYFESSNEMLLDQSEENSENKSNSFSDNHHFDIQSDQEFFEIKPLVDGVNFQKQKDISSQPIQSVDFPKVLYMVINQNIELEPKLLKEYPEWDFLSKEDLNSYALEIFSDQNLAKKSCKKNQKIIKIPNTNVFQIASSKLRSNGISRIVFGDLLISL
tara:strand:+ start:1956 stop:2609 length:654 start_codon:yes stop_codon:yes gene_type:complete